MPSFHKLKTSSPATKNCPLSIKPRFTSTGSTRPTVKMRKLATSPLLMSGSFHPKTSLFWSKNPQTSKPMRESDMASPR